MSVPKGLVIISDSGQWSIEPIDTVGLPIALLPQLRSDNELCTFLQVLAPPQHLLIAVVVEALGLACSRPSMCW